MIRHGKGIHCLHIFGWDTDSWCPGCTNHWHHTFEEASERGTPGARAAYQNNADVTLAYNVLTALEAGEIPISPLLADFDLSLAFVERMPTSQPSAN